MFPPVEFADDDGLLCWGGDLSVETLVEAYGSGIFPWPHEGMPLLWFAPPLRGVLQLDEFHLSRRTQRAIRSANFSFKINADFSGVLQGCAQKRNYSDGTWITPEIQAAYEELHRLKIAHSVETYLENELVGGLYGVCWGHYFCGESMFHRADNASKAALGFLVEHMKSRGANWIDVQLLNPLFESLGAREIAREQFLEMLGHVINQPTCLFDYEPGA